MVSLVVFDLDLTLCDFFAAKKRADKEIALLAKERGLDPDLTVDTIWLAEHLAYMDLCAGKIGSADYMRRRYEDAADKLHDGVFVRWCNDIYWEQTNGNIPLFDDVLPCLTWLKEKNMPLALLTNGPTEGQMLKVCSSGLDKFFTHVFPGEAIGFFKPQPEAFRFVLSHRNCPPEEALMVGDSFEDDCLAAEGVGMQSLLVDRQERYTHLRDKRIGSLLELPDRL